MLYIRRYASPLGGITLLSDGEALTGLWFDGQAHFDAARIAGGIIRPLPVLEDAARWLDVYFSGRAPDFVPRLRLKGTDFQRAVWSALLTLQRGTVTTYGEIAAMVARRPGALRTSARAVGGAVARNPISIIVPCHRVVGADGGLTGYAGGLERKVWLLSLEGVQTVEGRVASRQIR